MVSVIDILEQLESDNSRLFKEDFLEAHRKNDLLRKVFVTVGDPYTNFYVNKFKMPPPNASGDEDDDVVENFIVFITTSLAARQITGNTAKEAVISLFEMLSEKQQKWCLRILLKNLRCGVQETTVNKVWPGSITKFAVQLAETLDSHFEKDKGILIDEDIAYPVRVEPKLDGLRCIAVKRGGEVTMFTRNGTVLETLPRVKAALEAAPWDDFVLDGEIMGADWNESASVVMSRKKSKDDSNMVFHVFDAMHFDDWQRQENADPLADRIQLVDELLGRLPSNAPVLRVSGETVGDHQQLLNFYSKAMEGGYEGIMVKRLDSAYEFKRSRSILKLKPVTTYEGVVVGSYDGRRGSKREGLWGGFEVVLPNGVVTRLGGGFTDKLKAEIGVDPEGWIGRVIEMEGQPDPLTENGLTKDGKVRFPVFVRVRDESDVDRSVVDAGKTYLVR